MKVILIGLLYTSLALGSQSGRPSDEHGPRQEAEESRSVLLATSESEASDWLDACSEAKGSNDERWAKVGTLYDLGEGVVGVVARSVFDPEALFRRAAILGDLATRIRRSRRALPFEELGPDARGAVRELVLSGSTPQAAAASLRDDTEIGFQLSVRYTLNVQGFGTLTVDADSRALEPRAAPVLQAEVERAPQQTGPTLLDTPWSWRSGARLHFHRTGDIETQFRLAARLFGTLTSEAGRHGREVMSSATALNDAIRQATGLETRGSTSRIPASSLSSDTRTLLLDTLRKLQRNGRLPSGTTAGEILSRSLVEGVRVRPALVVVTNLGGRTERFVRELSFH